MAQPYHSHVDNAYSAINTAYGKIALAISDQNFARLYYDAADESKALDYLIDAVGHVCEYMPYALTYRGGTPRGFYITDALKALWEYENEPAAEFTMDLLLSTMLEAEPDNVMYFVGLVDAYRQSVWNRPFNVDFFAALARGFEQWP